MPSCCGCQRAACCLLWVLAAGNLQQARPGGPERSVPAAGLPQLLSAGNGLPLCHLVGLVLQHMGGGFNAGPPKLSWRHCALLLCFSL